MQLKHVDDLQSYNFLSRGPKGNHTYYYLAQENDVDVGFIAVDKIPRSDAMILYEIFITDALRVQGLGEKLLTEVRTLAKKSGYTKIKLNPEPLDESVSKERLIEWYTKNKYTLSEVACEMELDINVTNT